MRIAGPSAVALLALGLAPFGLAAEDEPGEPPRPVIYKWVDQNGIAHYTTDRDRIPHNLRNRIRSPSVAPPDEDAGTREAAPVAPRREDYWSVREAPAEGVGRGDFREGGDPVVDPRIEEALRERRADLDGQIAALEEEIARDEQALKRLISDARTTDDGRPAPLYGNAELEELARRFPRLQADLAALRAERRRLDLEPGS